MDEFEKVMEILKSNREKQFVKRILDPEKYPYIQNEDGSRSTHKMAWAEADGKYYVFPTIVWDGKSLTPLDPRKAFEDAKKTGNLIEFKTPEEADWFSRKYKEAWGDDVSAD